MLTGATATLSVAVLGLCIGSAMVLSVLLVFGCVKVG